ncbi:RHS repeat-associated core domain-containing protein, partial [Streptomyces caelestis]|uniref:RHS repeat-associated core domain-containing protein n=1 Tax=Streptomyces caelestis TaxID=36816 RepID=UPI00382E6758
MSVTTSGTAGGTREYTYNKDTPTCGGFEGQRCTAKDGNSKVTSFEYDAKGNLKTVILPAPLGKTEYTYDALGRVETVIDGRGIKTVYTYDNRDRVTKVSSTNATVTYSYDGNVKTRTDASGTTGWDYDKLNRESIRTLQNGAQTALAYTPGGDVDHYTDPTGKTDYTWDKAGRLDYLTAPDGKKTDFDYNKNDKRTKTVYPRGTTQAVGIDDNGRPEAIKATSGSTTLIDLAYSYKNTAGKDTTKIRTRTDNLTKNKTTYDYDFQGRLRYALEADSAGARKASWLYWGQGRQPHLPGRHQERLPRRHHLHLQRRERTDRQERHHHGLVLRQARQRNRRRERHRPHEGDVDGLQPTVRHHRGRQVLRPGPRRHDQLRAHQAGFDLVPPHRTRPGLHDDQRHRHRIHPRTGGHAELHDDWGEVLLLPHRRHRQRPRPRRRHRQAHPHLRLRPHRPAPRATPTEVVPQPYRYSGAYLDPTGLYKMGHRYYDPTLGRFTQPDPSGQESNAYLYADGDPINNTDPTGLFDLGGTLAAAGASIAATVAVTLVAGPVAGAAVGGCVGGAVGESVAGGSLTDSAKSCALEVLTEVVDQVTVGLSARWSGRGETSVVAVDRVGRTVVAHRAVTARAGAEAGGGPAASA